MKQIEHELKINSDAKTLFQALTTKSGLESWHSAHIDGDFKTNGLFTINHQDNPSFTWKIIQLEPNSIVQWQCITGPGNAPGTEVSFRLKPCDDQRILLECVHQGWSETSENFKKCNTLWGMLLDHLKHFAETGDAKPTFN